LTTAQCAALLGCAFFAWRFTVLMRRARAAGAFGSSTFAPARGASPILTS
jgi:hypothetical protein